MLKEKKKRLSATDLELPNQQTMQCCFLKLVHVSLGKVQSEKILETGDQHPFV